MGIEKRLTTSIIVLAAATVLIAAGGGIPAVMSIRSLQNRTAAENQKIEKAYAMRHITDSTIGTVMEINKNIRAMGPVSIVEGAELDFINALEVIAGETEVTQNIELVTANQEELSKFEKNVPLKISLEGDYRQVIQYFRKLDRLPYYLMARDLRIAVPTRREGAGDGQVKATYEGMVRWLSKDHPALQPIGTSSDR